MRERPSNSATSWSPGSGSGMHTLEASLRMLVEQGIITAEAAAASSAHPAELTGRA